MCCRQTIIFRSCRRDIEKHDILYYYHFLDRSNRPNLQLICVYIYSVIVYYINTRALTFKHNPHSILVYYSYIILYAMVVGRNNNTRTYYSELCIANEIYIIQMTNPRIICLSRKNIL